MLPGIKSSNEHWWCTVDNSSDKEALRALEKKILVPSRCCNKKMRFLLQGQDLLLTAGTPVDTSAPQAKQLLQWCGSMLDLLCELVCRGDDE